MLDIRHIRDVRAHTRPFFARRFDEPLPTVLQSASNSMIATGRGSTDFEDERAPAQSAYVETLYGHRRTLYPFYLSPMARHRRTPYPFHYSAMARQTNEKRKMSKYKREKGGSSRAVAYPKGGQSILLVHTYQYLCVLDLKGNLNADGHYTPVLLRKIYLYEEGFPLFMGLLKLDKNDVYMFGGSYTIGYHASRMTDCEPFCYQLDSGSWSLRYTKELDNTKAPKIDPYVAKVDNKILVVEGRNRVDSIKQPFIEYYDLTSNTWNEFLDIPAQNNWSKKEEALIRSGKHSGVLLVGYKFYIKFGDYKNQLFFCLNTRARKWEEESSINMLKSFQKLYIAFPNQGMCVPRIAGLHDDQYIILYRSTDSIYAYFFDNFGSLLSYQDLTKKLCHGIIPNFGYMILFIDMKSGGRMCMVSIEERDYTAESGPYQDSLINIRHFELKFIRGSAFDSKYFLSTQLKKVSFVDIEVIDDQKCAIPGVREAKLALLDAVLL